MSRAIRPAGRSARTVAGGTSPARRAALVGGVLASAAVAGPVLTVATGIGWALTRRWRRARAEAAAARRRADAVPELIELLVVLIEAGCSPAKAIRESIRHAPKPLVGNLREVIEHLDVGIRLGDALAVLTDRIGEPVRVLVDTIVRAETYGDPLAPLLLRLHDEAVRQRRVAAEVAARQLPIRLCFPLVCCTLPSFVLLTIVPLLAGAFSSLRQGAP